MLIRNRDMTQKEYDILYTLIWLIFIGFLCWIFNSHHPLWLFILYFLGKDW